MLLASLIACWNLRSAIAFDSAELKRPSRRHADAASALRSPLLARTLDAHGPFESIDFGLGMSLAELELKFGDYASAKAKGEKTRSLFGRGALDVLLYHQESVRDPSSRMVVCRAGRFFWEKDTMYDPE